MMELIHVKKVFNEPLNNYQSFNFQNLICLCLPTPKIRFSCIDITFSFTICRDIKA